MEFFELNEIWMHAIGKTILHSIWIGLLILAFLRLALAYVPTKSARLRYAISVSALLFLFFSVIGAFILLYEPVMPQLNTSQAYGNIQEDSAKLFGGIKSVDSSLLFTIFGYLYFGGILLMLFRSMASLNYIRAMKNERIHPGADWQERFSILCNKLGIKRHVDFFQSTRVNTPLLVAYLKPAVIVPVGMLTNLPASQIETILLHELYHLKRRDSLVNAMQLFIEGVLFYHPVAWIISGFIRAEREHCCDDKVLNSDQSPLDYAKALVHIAEQQKFIRLVPGAVGSEKHHFYTRINRILNQNTMKTNMREKVLALTLLAGSLIILIGVSGFRAAPSFLIANEINPVGFAVMDTIPQKGNKTEREAAKLEAIEEMETARLEAIEEMEKIDWESMKKEMETARLEAIEEIDWESMKKEMDAALKEVREIDWVEVKTEMEHSFAEMKVDMEKMKMEIEHSMKEIDWDEIREEMNESFEKSRIHLDSIKTEMDL